MTLLLSLAVHGMLLLTWGPYIPLDAGRDTSLRQLQISVVQSLQVETTEENPHTPFSEAGHSPEAPAVRSLQAASEKIAAEESTLQAQSESSPTPLPL